MTRKLHSGCGRSGCGRSGCGRSGCGRSARGWGVLCAGEVRTHRHVTAFRRITSLRVVGPLHC